MCIQCTIKGPILEQLSEVVHFCSTTHFSTVLALRKPHCSRLSLLIQEAEQNIRVRLKPKHIFCWDCMKESFQQFGVAYCGSLRWLKWHNWVKRVDYMDSLWGYVCVCKTAACPLSTQQCSQIYEVLIRVEFVHVKQLHRSPAKLKPSLHTHTHTQTFSLHAHVRRTH